MPLTLCRYGLCYRRTDGRQYCSVRVKEANGRVDTEYDDRWHHPATHVLRIDIRGGPVARNGQEYWCTVCDYCAPLAISAYGAGCLVFYDPAVHTWEKMMLIAEALDP